MRDPAEIIAMLYAHGARYDSVPGSGEPEITAAEIDSAIARIPDTLAREVWCAIYWHSTRADELIRIEQLRACAKRQRALAVAIFAHQVAQDRMDGTHGGIHAARRDMAHARAEMETARAENWPHWGRRYTLIRAAVLSELRDPRACKRCAGRGSLMVEALARPCDACGGIGRRKVSDTARAEMIGVSQQVYSARWREPYEWTLALCRDAATDASEALKSHLAQVAKMGVVSCA